MPEYILRVHAAYSFCSIKDDGVNAAKEVCMGSWVHEDENIQGDEVSWISKRVAVSLRRTPLLVLLLGSR